MSLRLFCGIAPGRTRSAISLKQPMAKATKLYVRPVQRSACRFRGITRPPRHQGLRRCGGIDQQGAARPDHDTDQPGEHAKRMQLFKNIAGRINTPTLHCVPGENYAALDGDVLSRGRSLNSQRNAFAVRAYSRAVERACERALRGILLPAVPPDATDGSAYKRCNARRQILCRQSPKARFPAAVSPFQDWIPEREYPDAADVPIAVSRPARRNLRQRGILSLGAMK
jgi:hypothetical protein